MAKIEWMENQTEHRRRQQLVSRLSKYRKKLEEEGVVVNGARFSGDPANRQALNEALQLASRQGMTLFPVWKDSDNVFFLDFSVSDVDIALIKIGERRNFLITKESQYASEILNGNLTTIGNLDWSTSSTTA